MSNPSGPNGIEITVTHNIRDFVNNLGLAQKKIEQRLPAYVRQCCADICTDLIKHSYPAEGNDIKSGKGGTYAAVNQGFENIKRDVWRGFTHTGNIKAGDAIMQRNADLIANLGNPIVWQNEGLKKAWESRNVDVLYKAFKQAGWEESDGKIHYVDVPTVSIYQKMRDPNTGAIKEALKHNKALRIHTPDKSKVDQIIAEKFKSVGKMAGGWVECLRQLSRMSPIVYPSKKGSGKVYAVGQGAEYGVIAVNEFGDFNGMVSRENIIEPIMQQRGQAFLRDVGNMVQRLIAWAANPTAYNP